MPSEALGRLFDVGPVFAPVDLNTADGATGLRINMSMHQGVTVVLFLGVAASGTDDNVITLKQHTAYTGGTTSNLASATVSDSYGLTSYYVKSEIALDNDEAWTRVTQAEAATFTLAGATYATLQKIVVFDVRADQLGAAYSHFSVSSSITTSAAQLAAGFYLPHDLKYQRKPASLFNLLRPGAANA
jgi:hypothetical protein